MEEEIKEDKLNLKQEKFCQLYAGDKELFGHGTGSYMEAYNVEPAKWKTAMVNASRLLSNAKILRRINELLELNGLNTPFVDKQLEFLVTQNADFKSKLGAIKEYNQLKNRIKTKLDITSGDEKLGSISMEMLSLAEEELKKRKLEDE